MDMSKLFYAIVVGFHLSTVALHHIASAALVSEPLADLAPPLQRVKAIAPIRYYAHYTGTGIGSGYFAPRVGSSFRVHAMATDTDGHMQRIANYPWATRTAQLRYTAFCQLYQEFTNRDDPSGHVYEQAVARQIGSHMASQFTAQVEKVVISVSVFRPPTLAQYRQGRPPMFREIFRDTTTISTLPMLP